MQKPEIKTGLLKIVFWIVLACFLVAMTTNADFWFASYKELGKEKNYYEAKYNELLKEKLKNEMSTEEIAKLKYYVYYFGNSNPMMLKILHEAYIAAQKYKLDPYLVLSVIKVESNFDPMARSSVAHGLMQVNVSAWKAQFDIDAERIYEIDYNLDLGCKILKYYMDEANGNVGQALFAYNNGTAGIYNNTKYAPKVMDEYTKYR